MGPRHVAGEVLEEERGGDRAGASRGVVAVGDAGGDLVLVVGDERHPPGVLARRGRRGLAPGRPGPRGWRSSRRSTGRATTFIAPVRVAMSTRAAGASSLTAYAIASASTRRPSASVLLTSEVRPAEVGDDVAGAHRGAADGVLRGRHEADHADRAVDVAERSHGGDDGAAAAHVALHRQHALAGLDVEAAGVEGDALADEDHRGHALGGPARGVVHADQPGLVDGAAADGADAAEALGLEPLRRPRPAPRGRLSLADLDGLLGQPGRGLQVGRDGRQGA